MSGTYSYSTIGIATNRSNNHNTAESLGFNLGHSTVDIRHEGSSHSRDNSRIAELETELLALEKRKAKWRIF